jgi:hypothetical protein
MAILRGILDPAFFEDVRFGRQTTDEAAGLITAAIAPWYGEREAQAAKPQGTRAR